MKLRQFPGHLLAFKSDGGGDQVADHDALVELTDTDPEGTVEIACNTQLPGRPRVYLQFRLQDLVAALMRHGKDDS